MLSNLVNSVLFAGTTEVGDDVETAGDGVGFEKLAPNGEGLPGGEVALNITQGVMFYSLLLCLVGLVLSAGLWAVGAFSNNYTQSVNGKKGFLICAAAALAIGAAYVLVGWFFAAGNEVE